MSPGNITEKTGPTKHRKLRAMESFLYQAEKSGLMIIRYLIKLSSKQPIKEPDFKSTLIHLERKVPTLRLCIRDGGKEELWFGDMEQPDEIDYQICNYSSYEKTYEDIIHQQFDTHRGPLWRARLFPCPTGTECPISELQEDFPHQYNLLIAFHHSITDGSSNIRICNLLIELFNDVIAGHEIDNTQLGSHGTMKFDDDVIEEIKTELSNDENKLKSLKKLRDDIYSVEIKLIEAYPSDSPYIQKTDSVHWDLTVEETRDLLRKCKSHGVTVNSALCTAINAAMVEMLEARGFKDEIYKIQVKNLVNLRRYRKDPDDKYLGTSITSITTAENVCSDIQYKFWDYARKYDSQISDLLNKKACYVEAGLNELIPNENHLIVILKGNPKNMSPCLYVTSNLGKLDFPGTGDHVQATYISRCTSLRNLVSVHEAHTFRGRLIYGIDYKSQYLSQEGAQLWCSTTMKLLSRVV